MERFLRIFVFITLVLSGKTDRTEETTTEFETTFQSTTLTNELHAVKHNASEMITNFSSPNYNSQNTLNPSFKKLISTYSNRFFPSTTSKIFHENIINNATTGELQVYNNNSFNESEIVNNMLGQSSSSTDSSNNSSKHTTLSSMLSENTSQNKNFTFNLEFHNENTTTQVSFVGNVTPHIIERVTLLPQNTFKSRIEIEQKLNTSLQSSNISFSTHFILHDLDENNTTTTKIPETDTEEYLPNVHGTMNSLLKNVEISKDSSEGIMNSQQPVSATTDTIEAFSTNVENSNFEESETSSPSLSTLAATNIRDSSENILDASTVSNMSENETLNSIDSMHETTTKTNSFSFNISTENENINKQENPLSINQSSLIKNYSENKTTIIPTQHTIVLTQDRKQKDINNYSTVFRNNNFKEEEMAESHIPTRSITVTSASSRSLPKNSVQTSSIFPIKENVSVFTRLPFPTVVIQDHRQKEFFFKHVNNLTDNQRQNMTIDIIFISAVDIVEWFHSYDRVFRTTIASLLTEANGSQSTQSINIIYVAPTPLKNEKYFCITFMVESAFHKYIYELGEVIVQKIKQNVSELEQTLHLPVESVVAGYNETGKCHKSHRLMQEKNWVIIVVLGTILTVAIVVILTMCIQKSRNGKQSWEQDVQEWSVNRHRETGRYHSNYHLPINVQNPSNNIVENLSRVNQKISLKEENNSLVPSNHVEKVLIHNEEKNYPETCGECNKMFVEDTKL